MKALTRNGKWTQLSGRLYSPLAVGMKIHPFSLRHYVLSKAVRTRSDGEPSLARLSAYEPQMSQREMQSAANQPRKRALERWESEGGATELTTPRSLNDFL